jgi:hypothetical protein
MESFKASPYMEKYVLEALFVMNEPELGLERMKERFYGMVEKSPYTTLYENFAPRHLYDQSGFIGHGSNNHAWSGGGLTILSQYACGLYPVEPAWKTFRVKPQLGSLEWAETGNETIAGKVAVKVTKAKLRMDIEVTVPSGSEAVVYVPSKKKKVTISGKKITSKEKEGNYTLYRIKSGDHKIIIR